MLLFVEIVDRTRVHFELDGLAAVRFPLPVLPAFRRPVHVVVHDGAERVSARFLRLSFRGGQRQRHWPVVVPTTEAVAAVPVSRGRGPHGGRDHVIRHGRGGAVAAFATTLHDHHLDERHHRVAYLAHLPGQLELLEQAHVAAPLERRVLVTEREQLSHAQRVIVAKQPGQLTVSFCQRLKITLQNETTTLRQQ